MAITVSTASAQGGELAGGGGHRLGNAVQAQLDFGDDAERALGADEQPRQVVAGGGLADPPAGADQPAVGQRHGQAEHVLADGAVAHRVGAGGARRAHAADGAGRGAGIDREEQALVAQMLVQLVAGDARLDAAVHVGWLTSAPRHARQVELMPPRTGVTWPSSEVPAPQAPPGRAAALQRASRRAASSDVSMNATASGMTGGWVSWPCEWCSRRVALVVMRSPRKSRAAAITVSAAWGIAGYLGVVDAP